MNDYLMHYGRGHLDGGHSGRYPWGSGDDPCQRERDFVSRVKNYRAKGYTDRDIAERMGVMNEFHKPSAKRLQARMSNYTNAIKKQNALLAQKWSSEGLSNGEICDRLGMSRTQESTVRGWLKEGYVEKRSANQETAKMLEQLADKKKFVDISSGSELYLGVSSSSLSNAKELAKEDGYVVSTIKVPQMNGRHQTTLTVISPPGTKYGEVIENRFDVKPVFDESRVFNEDGKVISLGISKEHIHSISPDRVKIIYREDKSIDGIGTGGDKDGLIEIRRGLKDISIGSSSYAQVRIPVDGTHYIKGMAVYSDNLPDGVDICFNTSKHRGKPMIDGDNGVLKPMKHIKDSKGNDTGEIDWDNPFGASVQIDKIHQLSYVDEKGKRQYSACNIVNDEGDWLKWDKNVSSQLGSKQPVKLIERQLKLDVLDKKAEFDAINSLTNPSIKKSLLIEFADKCDTAAVELKAAPFPGQSSNVIIPCTKLKDGEIYAPNYKDGTVVALVRFPYAGPFESPVLTVRNTGSPAKKIIGPNAPDAVAINSTAASQMSGADFDGDSVVVIPLSDKVPLKTAKRLKGLENFDHMDLYPSHEGMNVMTPENKQNQMGRVTNLIADMTLQAAKEEHILRAVKHSMVIIDSEKHKLDWKKSEFENGIAELKNIYQRDAEGHTGAGTIVTRAGAEMHIPAKKDWKATSTSIDPEGRKILVDTDETRTKVKLKGEKIRDPESGRLRTVYPEGTEKGGWVGVWENGDGNYYYQKLNSQTGKKERIYVNENDYTNKKTEKVTQEVSRMELETDAFKLTSGGSKEHYGYPVERPYAEYANSCKALANEARKTWLNTNEGKKDPEAAKKYSKEVESLEAKLRIAEAHSPLERQATLMANRTMVKKRMDNPDMEKEQEKKYRTQAINAARRAWGVKRKDVLINITDKEWEAIQNKAISPNKLNRIIKNTDSDALKKRATPRDTKTVGPSMEALIKSLAKSGFTNEQIADRVGFSTSTVYNVISGKIDKERR